MTKRGFVCIFVFLFGVFFFISSCTSSKQEDISEAEQASGETTGEVLPPSEESFTTPPFPHPEDWGEPLVHGDWVTHGGEKSCLQCHPLDTVKEGGAPACHSCHPLYPHSNGWVQKENHGTFVNQKNPDALSCASSNCHGSDLQGRPANVPAAQKQIKGCNDCHLKMPHQEVWDHGKSVVDASGLLALNACTGCHGNDLLGDVHVDSCYSCHKNYPQPHRTAANTKNLSWTRDGEHGNTVHQAAPQEKSIHAATQAGCVVCHGANLSGGAAEKSCYSCHPSYPHRDQFENHSSLLMSQKPLSAQIDPCRLCHGVDLAGGLIAPSCFGCHQSFPHPVAGVPGENFSPWLAKHGDYFTRKEDMNAPTCATANCHGLDLQGNPPGIPVFEKQVKGCDDCHLRMPHRQAWDHGKSAVNEEGLLDLQACIQCHGENLRGDANTDSCYQCHSNYPQPHRTAEFAVDEAWQRNGGHGDTLRELFPGARGQEAAQLAGCTTCHGEDLSGGVSGKACNSCHAVYPHNIGGWGDKEGHGRYVKTRGENSSIQEVVSNECGACHTNPAPNSLARNCTSCHDPQNQYPHPQGWYNVNDSFGGGHGFTVALAAKTDAARTAGCLTACHGTDGQSGFVPSNNYCSTCHEKYPHLSNTWKASDVGYASHALAVLNTNNTETKNDDTFNAEKFAACSGCHGEVLQFESNRYALLPEETSTFLNDQALVDRCYACHRYPHQTFRGYHQPEIGVEITDGATYSWGPGVGRFANGHMLILYSWNPQVPLDNGDFVNQTCGAVDGGAGCHSSGPVSPGRRRDQGAERGQPRCLLCHPGPQ